MMSTLCDFQDIIWHAFKESCTARVLPHTAISNPYSGMYGFLICSKWHTKFISSSNLKMKAIALGSLFSSLATLSSVLHYPLPIVCSI